MVDVLGVVNLIAERAVFFGAILFAIGLVLGLARRALTYLILALGIIASVSAALIGLQQGSMVLALAVLGAGLLVSALLGFVVKLGALALEFAVFLGSWFLLFYGVPSLGLAFILSNVGAILWVVATVLSTFAAERLARVVPDSSRALVRHPRPVKPA